MPRIPALTPEQAPAESRPLLEGVQKAFGVLPNVFRTLGHSPVVLSAYLQLTQTLAKNSLTASENEVVALAVSQANECEYCLSAHSYFGAKFGLSTEDMQRARHGDLDIFSRFTHQIVMNHGKVSDEQISAARSAGLTDAKIVEIIAQIAVLTITNLLNNVAQTEVDFPRVDA